MRHVTFDIEVEPLKEGQPFCDRLLIDATAADEIEVTIEGGAVIALESLPKEIQKRIQEKVEENFFMEDASSDWDRSNRAYFADLLGGPSHD